MLTGAPNELERNAVIEAALNLFQASMTAGFRIAIPNTTPPVFIVAGEQKHLLGMINMENAANDHAEDEYLIKRLSGLLAEIALAVNDPDTTLRRRNYDELPEKVRQLVQHEPVIQNVIAERLRQDEKWGGASHDDHHTVADFVQLIEDYAGWARTMAGMDSVDKARNRLIQVAALAVAATQMIDRKHKADSHE
jgi:hypothetical protein